MDYCVITSYGSNHLIWFDFKNNIKKYVYLKVYCVLIFGRYIWAAIATPVLRKNETIKVVTTMPSIIDRYRVVRREAHEHAFRLHVRADTCPESLFLTIVHNWSPLLYHPIGFPNWISITDTEMGIKWMPIDMWNKHIAESVKIHLASNEWLYRKTITTIIISWMERIGYSAYIEKGYSLAHEYDNIVRYAHNSRIRLWRLNPRLDLLWTNATNCGTLSTRHSNGVSSEQNK